MPNVYQPGLIQYRPQYAKEFDNDTPENIVWLKATSNGPFTLSQLQALQAVLDPAWGDVWACIGATGRSMTGSVITDWTSSSGLQSNSVGTFVGQPGSEGAEVPANVAALISWQIAERYRGGHGRVYLPSLGASVIFNDNFLVASAITALTTQMGNFTLATSTYPGPVGPLSIGVLRARGKATQNFQIVHSFEANGQLASQRRRLRRVAHR